MPPELIALPGGTGTIGTSIISALLLPENKELYIPIILSRATPTNPPGSTSTKQITSLLDSKTYEVKTRFVDYTSIPSLITAIKCVYAVISTLLIPGPECVEYHLNLLSACIQSDVKRFAASEFALPHTSHGMVDVDKSKITIWKEIQSAVQEGKIDAAAFPVGMFLNYLAIGHPDLNVEREGRAGFREGPLMFYLGSDNPYSEIPLSEDGNGKSFPDLTMTDIRDVGRYIVAVLGMEEAWGGRELGIAGDTMNLKDISTLLRMVLGERYTGKSVSIAELEERIAGPVNSAEDFFQRMETQYVIACGRGGSVVDGVLNRIFPEIKPMGIREFLERYWGGVSENQ
ncbi:uncharacterized protein BDV14DRAFT_199284 [Aspergillus stella-maris]|uniref:uncharacterized protein n=1 Tax=Aspergillus stella-maris TaxID=1810926 RepID=UPI003CCE2089